MSCNANNIFRTPYDQLMGRVYNPTNVSLYPAPWPMEKTVEDLLAQKKFCNTDCGRFQTYPNKDMPMLNASNSDGIINEGFDIQVQDLLINQIHGMTRMFGISGEDSKMLFETIKNSDNNRALQILETRGIPRNGAEQIVNKIKSLIETRLKENPAPVKYNLPPGMENMIATRVTMMTPFLKLHINDGKLIVEHIKNGNSEEAVNILVSKGFPREGADKFINKVKSDFFDKFKM